MRIKKFLWTVMIVVVIMFAGCTEKVTVVEVSLPSLYWTVYFVVRGSGELIPNALIQLVSTVDSRIEYTETTNMLGVARFVGVRQGSFYITITATGFSTEKNVINVFRDDWGQVFLTPSEVSGIVRVHCMFWSKTPSAIVKLIYHEDENITFTKATDANGEAHFESIPSGRYTVIISSDEYEPLEEILHFTSNNFLLNRLLVSRFTWGYVRVLSAHMNRVPGALVLLRSIHDENIYYTARQPSPPSGGVAYFQRVLRDEYFITVSVGDNIIYQDKLDLRQYTLRNNFYYTIQLEPAENKNVVLYKEYYNS